MRIRRICLRRRILAIAASGLLFSGGCGLSDYQLATVWQSVLTAGLDTIVTGAVTAIFGGTTANQTTNGTTT